MKLKTSMILKIKYRAKGTTKNDLLEPTSEFDIDIEAYKFKKYKIYQAHS